MPYIVLALVGFVPAAWTLLRRREGALLATAFVAMGLVDLADWIAYSCLGLYEYRPNLVQHPVLDETIGVILADYLFVGSLSVILVRHFPRWLSVVLGAALVTVVQEGFTRAGLFVLHGWTPTINLAGFLVYFWLLDAFHASLARHGGRTGLLRLATQSGVIYALMGLAALVQKVSKAYVVNLSLLSKHGQNQSLFRLIFQVGFVVPLGLWVLRGPGLNRQARIVVSVLAGTLFNYGRVFVLRQRYTAPWSPLNDALFLGLAVTAAAVLDDWIQAWSEPAEARLS